MNINSVLSLPAVVNLNPNKAYEKIVPAKRIRCVSCAREELETMRHPITYKSVIKHYEHVLHLFKETCGKSGDTILTWPPDRDIIDAAGGVGFGCLDMVSEFDRIKSTRIDMSSNALTAQELHIPPILRYLHPKLRADDYHRCKKDPLFLYKSVTVCEVCYLVYAEFTTMVLRIGQDLTKLLTPDPSAAFLGSKVSSASQLQQPSTLSRPSSADWRAMSTLQRSHSSSSIGPGVSRGPGTLQPSINHDRALKKAIGLRTSDSRTQPEVPGTIRNGGSLESGGDSFAGSMRKSAELTDNSSFYTQTFEPDDIRAMVAERERRFFKEVSRNPQLRDQHPLMHLISSQQKLSLADEQSGVVRSKESSQKEGVFGSTYFGRQGGDEFDRFLPYKTELPYITRGQIILPSTLRKQKEKKKEDARARSAKRRADARRDDEDEDIDEFSEQPSSSSGQSPGASKNQSTKKSSHKAFLRNTLKQIEAEFAKAEVPSKANSNAGVPGLATERPGGSADGALGQSRPGTTLSPSRERRSNSSGPASLSSQPGRGSNPWGGASLSSSLPLSLGEEGEDEEEKDASTDTGTSSALKVGLGSGRFYGEGSVDGLSFSMDHLSDEKKLKDFGIGAFDSLHAELEMGAED